MSVVVMNRKKGGARRRRGTAEPVTSLSWAISCVRGDCACSNPRDMVDWQLDLEGGGNDVRLQFTSTSHIVQVVSMEHVPMTLGSVSFQSKDVIGAQYSF